jgi:Carboxypeptidase regulatory-like domain
MKSGLAAVHIRVALTLALLLSLTGAQLLLAQNATGSLRGQVVDPSGAAIPNAPLQLTTPAGQVLTATSNASGAYEFNNLAPGKYTIEVTVKNFEPYKKEAVEIVAGQAVQLNVSLILAAEKEEVTVSDQAQSVDTTPSANASAVVLTDKELEALPDDPDELQQDLEALAGPSAGPNGGQMYIDGFTAGQLPPKSSIREIRINQNPFAAEFDKVGYGRIEIFTKPGTNQWHGQISVNKNDTALNARDPFATTSAGFESTQIEGNIGGPLGKNASLFFNVDERDIHDQALISTVTLGTNCNQGISLLEVACTQALSNPRTRLNGGPRLDYQLTKNNTLSARYQYFRNDGTDNGIGGLVLPSEAYNVLTTEQTLQLTDTQVIGSKIINETHFQYRREGGAENPYSTLPELDVLGAFTGGGNSLGTNDDHENLYELQNYTSIVFGKHFMKFGARVRAMNDSNTSTGNQATGFNGAFTFSSLNAYAITEQGLANGLSLAAIRAAGGGPSQFSIIIGTPFASVTMYDASPYVQDDWRVRPNLTLSYGLRFETQDRIADHADWAPRVGVAWGVGGAKPKFVLRAGWGIFYDRFPPNLVLQASRQNGATEQEFVIAQPNFFCPNSLSACPSIGTLQGTSVPTIYQIAPNLRSPMLMQSAVSVERQLTKIANISISYLNSRGWDQLVTNNVNSPVLPGTLIPTSAAHGGIYPNGIAENMYQYQSIGVFRQNQVVFNTTIRAGAKLSLNAYYSLNFANSDTAGANSFGSDPYNLMADYGRAAFDIRNRVFFGSTIGLPYGLRLSPFLVASSGVPYNITLGQDLIGSSIFNQRPAFASALSNPANVVVTPFGSFDTVPQPGETLVPINYLTGPSQFSLNMRLSKTFSFGHLPEGRAGQVGARQNGGGGGGRRGPGGGAPPVGGGGFGGGGFGGTPTPGRYSIVLSINVRNIFNNVNYSTPIGNLGSPLFGESTGLSGGGFGFGGGAQTSGAGATAGLPGAGAGAPAANRQIFLQATFGF